MNLVDRAKSILLTPAKEWEVIKGENLTIAEMFTKYAIFLAAIPALAGFIGYVAIGQSYGFGTFRWPIGSALTWAIVYYILGLVGTFAMGFIIDVLAPNFGSTKDLVASMKVAVFANTAAWIAGIFLIIPALSILVVVGGLYSLYLLYLGLQKIKNPPADKLVVYLVVCIVVAAVVFWLTGMIAGQLTFRAALINPLG